MVRPPGRPRRRRQVSPPPMPWARPPTIFSAAAGKDDRRRKSPPSIATPCARRSGWRRRAPLVAAPPEPSHERGRTTLSALGDADGGLAAAGRQLVAVWQPLALAAWRHSLLGDCHLRHGGRGLLFRAKVDRSRRRPGGARPNRPGAARGRLVAAPGGGLGGRRAACQPGEPGAYDEPRGRAGAWP